MIVCFSISYDNEFLITKFVEYNILSNKLGFNVIQIIELTFKTIFELACNVKTFLRNLKIKEKSKILKTYVFISATYVHEIRFFFKDLNQVFYKMLSHNWVKRQL